MIRFSNVSRSFVAGGKRRQILDNVSFEVPGGASVAVLAQSGSGASTLMNLLAGTDFPDSGRIETTDNLSWVVSNLKFEKSMTVRQNIRFLGRLTGMSDLDDLERRVLAIFDPGEKYRQSAGVITGAERKNLAFAVTMSIDFDGFLFDGRPQLDAGDGSGSFRPVIENRRAGSTLVIATDKLAKTSGLCTSAIVLHNGKARWFDDIDEANDTYLKIQAGNDVAI